MHFRILLCYIFDGAAGQSLDEMTHLSQCFLNKVPLDPNNPWKNEGFNPPEIWLFSPLKMRAVDSHGSL